MNCTNKLCTEYYHTDIITSLLTAYGFVNNKDFFLPFHFFKSYTLNILSDYYKNT